MAQAIKVENVSKLYKLGQVGTGSIAHDLNRFWHKIRRKEDPYLVIGETNDRTKAGKSEYVWSLKDVSFDIEQGDAVGIIGRNGAGKSTLLKILSRVTAPTKGSYKAKGRIASLLEVGTGFHPELTGKENIYLNGAILGMRKREITSKFDEIVDFAGVEKYIDTPVKRYSSGMYVRLAFAVAAHLESEILIVDEVLAVGDAEFQKKCLGKMGDVTKGEGRTVLFVSHNMAAVKQLCKQGILLDKGNIKCYGQIENVTKEYLKGSLDNSFYHAVEDEKKETQILNAEIINDEGTSTSIFKYDDSINIVFSIKNHSDEKGIMCILGIWDAMDTLILVERFELNPRMGYKKFKAKVPSKSLVPNRFKISLALDIPGVRSIEIMPEYLYFEISGVGAEIGNNWYKENGMVYSNLDIVSF